MRHIVLALCASTVVYVSPVHQQGSTKTKTNEQMNASKIRYYNIQRDRFSWTGDRSLDGGKTWAKNHLQIEARRIGPPRSLGPLTRVKGTAGAARIP